MQKQSGFQLSALRECVRALGVQRLGYEIEPRPDSKGKDQRFEIRGNSN